MMTSRKFTQMDIRQRLTAFYRYASIAKAYDKDLFYHDETLAKMEKFSKRRLGEQNEEQKAARMRMALFPKDSDVLFAADDLWVPVVVVNHKIYILPGIPRLFTSLLDGLKSHLLPQIDPANKKHRYLVATKEPESNIAPYLTKLAAKVAADGIKVGSYPKWAGGVYVSLLGKDDAKIQALLSEVEAGIKGERISVEQEMAEEEARRKEEIASIKAK